MRRSLLIENMEGEEIKELEIGKAVSIKTNKEFIFFERMNDGKWRLTFSESVVDDFSKIKCFNVLREE